MPIWKSATYKEAHPHSVPNHKSNAHFPRLLNDKGVDDSASQTVNANLPAQDPNGWQVVARRLRSKT